VGDIFPALKDSAKLMLALTRRRPCGFTTRSVVLIRLEPPANCASTYFQGGFPAFSVVVPGSCFGQRMKGVPALPQWRAIVNKNLSLSDNYAVILLTIVSLFVSYARDKRANLFFSNLSLGFRIYFHERVRLR